MRFGFSHRPIQPLQRSIELYQYAEELGFDYAWVPDQQFYQDPFACLAAAALSTRRITLGLAVTNPFTRHPALIARGIGVVDELAEGRMILALGAANRKQVLEPLGLDTARTAERLRETASIVRRLLAGERVEHETRNYTLKGIQLNYRPRADIPLWIGTRGPLVLELAGEVADGVLMEVLHTSSALDYALGRVATGAARAGRDLAAIETTCWQPGRVLDDESEITDEHRAFVAHMIGGTPDAVLGHIGVGQDVVAAVKADYAVGGPEAAARHITPTEVDQLTMIGTVEQIRAKVRRVQARGVKNVSWVLLMPYAEIRETLRRLAEEVLPEFRS
jgi:5,10-methylenetetrahydromethanopterin reductase